MKQDKRNGRILAEHGHYIGDKPSITYKSWSSAIQRCENPRTNGYKDYGGRGIKMCDRWRFSFANFLADMGERPSKEYSLERGDRNKDYEPGNVVWATDKDQARNRSTNVNITYNGKTQCLMDWCRELNLKMSTMSNRLLKGWTPEEAFSLPAIPGVRPDRLRKEKLITFNGESLSMYQWAKRLGILRATLSYRIKVWGLEKALSSVAPSGDRK